MSPKYSDKILLPSNSRFQVSKLGPVSRGGVYSPTFMLVACFCSTGDAKRWSGKRGFWATADGEVQAFSMSMLRSKKYTNLTLVLKWFLVTRTGT